MFKMSDHKYLLKFIDGSMVGDNDKKEITDKVIKFTSFVDIISGKWKKNLLIGLLFSLTLFPLLKLHLHMYTNLRFMYKYICHRDG